MAGMSQTRQGGESGGKGVTGVSLAEERVEAKSLSTGGKDSGCVHFLGLPLGSTMDGWLKTTQIYCLTVL